MSDNQRCDFVPSFKGPIGLGQYWYKTTVQGQVPCARSHLSREERSVKTAMTGIDLQRMRTDTPKGPVDFLLRGGSEALHSGSEFLGGCLQQQGLTCACNALTLNRAEGFCGAINYIVPGLLALHGAVNLSESNAVSNLIGAAEVAAAGALADWLSGADKTFTVYALTSAGVALML